ncbi:DnaA N-terminal domain-containing protein, partial [Pseudomonas protegens]|uniref:DnaA N-terminal domain-containing protein n=1 Tax=Pseudomonas protegens TaxID=380021 RepID=UPI0031F50553
MSVELWQQCVELLRDELPAQQFNTWIRPLQVEAEGAELRLLPINKERTGAMPLPCSSSSSSTRPRYFSLT